MHSIFCSTIINFVIHSKPCIFLSFWETLFLFADFLEDKKRASERARERERERDAGKNGFSSARDEDYVDRNAAETKEAGQFSRLRKLPLLQPSPSRPSSTPISR